MSELLPTPAKSHYLFNLRDLAKVVFGICMSEKEKVQNVDLMSKLWIHEVLRVFGDRLINDDDKFFLITNIRKTYTRFFGLNIDTVCGSLDKEVDGVKDGKVD
jgi:dynein heavy chain